MKICLEGMVNQIPKCQKITWKRSSFPKAGGQRWASVHKPRSPLNHLTDGEQPVQDCLVILSFWSYYFNISKRLFTFDKL